MPESRCALLTIASTASLTEREQQFGREQIGYLNSHYASTTVWQAAAPSIPRQLSKHLRQAPMSGIAAMSFTAYRQPCVMRLPTTCPVAGKAFKKPLYWTYLLLSSEQCCQQLSWPPWGNASGGREHWWSGPLVPRATRGIRTKTDQKLKKLKKTKGCTLRWPGGLVAVFPVYSVDPSRTRRGVQ